MDTGRIEPAHISYRFFAYVIDIIIIMVIVAILGAIAQAPLNIYFRLNKEANISGLSPSLIFWIQIIFLILLGLFAMVFLFIVPILYSSILEQSTLRATIGKRVLGLIVTDESNHRISFRTALKRAFIKELLGSFIWLFGGFLGPVVALIFLMTNEKQQALHDKVSHTFVRRMVKDKPVVKKTVYTGGGPYHEGDVYTQGGDYVGGDKKVNTKTS